MKKRKEEAEGWRWRRGGDIECAIGVRVRGVRAAAHRVGR